MNVCRSAHRIIVGKPEAKIDLIADVRIRLKCFLKNQDVNVWAKLK
jgi:hypothetical protein